MRPGLFRSIASTYGTQLFVLPMSLGSSVLQARLLGPEGRGQLSLISATVGVAVLYLGLGLPSALTFHVASNKVSPSQLRRPLALFVMMSLAVLSLSLLALIVAGKSEVVLGGLPLTVTVPAVLGLFSLATHNGWMTAILLGKREFSVINRVTMLGVVVPVSSYAVGLALKPLPLTPAAFAFCVLFATDLLKAALLARRVWSLDAVASTPNQAVLAPLKMMVGYSLLAWACDAIQFLTYRVDVWLVRDARGDAELGHYTLAVTLAEMVWLLSSAMASVLFPHVPGLSRAAATHLTCRLAGFALVASTAIAAAGFGLSIPLLPVLFTSAFSPSVSLLGLLLLGVAPYSVAKIVGNSLAGSGAMRYSLYTAILGMVVCVSLDLLLIPRWGATGAAIATATAYLVFTTVIVSFFRRHAQVPWTTLLRYAITRLPATS